MIQEEIKDRMESCPWREHPLGGGAVLVNDSLVTTFANNPVDVCYDMILKLYELKNF